MSTRQCDWLNQVGVRCGQPYGHLGQHGNGLLTTPRDAWHQYMGTTEAENAVKFEKVGIVWTGNSKVGRCLYQFPNTRCIYELGHTLPHKEESR
jgi:hypothetical protein